jgi:hypothetical protein
MSQEFLSSSSYVEESGFSASGSQFNPEGAWVNICIALPVVIVSYLFAESWEALVDPQTNTTYYWNTATGQTQWDKPTSYDASKSNIETSIESSNSLVSELISSEDGRSVLLSVFNEVY